MNFREMHRQRKAIMIVAVTGMISSFLPWNKNMDLGIQIYSIALVIVYLFPLFWAFVGERKQPVTTGLIVGVAMPGIVAGSMGAMELLNMRYDVKSIYIERHGPTLATWYYTLAGLILIFVAYLMIGKKDEEEISDSESI